MLTGIELTNFKNFKHADIPLGKFTVIVGANATGKSNIRDAMRFLHGLARGYTLAETVGGKYGDGGEHVWRGIRGGAKSLLMDNNSAMSIGTRFIVESAILQMALKFVLGKMKSSELRCSSMIVRQLVELERTRKNIENDNLFLEMKYFLDELEAHQLCIKRCPEDYSLHPDDCLKVALQKIDYSFSDTATELFENIRFSDLVPERMRLASFRDQKTLGDQGENLSSAIYHIYQNPIRKAALMEWITELTPMDVVDFEFPEDQIGRILVTFVEKDGRKTTAYSASDGTLRFLCYAAALLTEEPAKVHFFEELDNGIHPSRLHLLVQLIEKAVAEGKTQVIATTHSPQMLSYLSEETLQSALLVYRLPGEPDAKVKRIVEIPDALRLIKEQGIARLHATGWLEDAVYLTEDAK